jgi:hypothetical protein
MQRSKVGLQTKVAMRCIRASPKPGSFVILKQVDAISSITAIVAMQVDDVAARRSYRCGGVAIDPGHHQSNIFDAFLRIGP